MTLRKTLLALALGALVGASAVGTASASPYWFFGGHTIFGYVGW